MPPEEDFTPVVSTACAPYHGLGVPSEDLTQEGWVAVLDAAGDYDPNVHRCERNAYLVTRIRSRLSRMCEKARRCAAAPLWSGMPARDHTPLDEAIHNERLAREGL